MFKQLYRLGFIGIIFATVFVCCSNLRIGIYRFGGYDLSPLIDVGWRITSGQVPYRDFICTLPPSLYLLVAAMFKLRGVNWQSLLLAASVSSFLFILVGLRIVSLMRANFGGPARLLIFTAYSFGVLEGLLAVNHPWHSTLAQDFIVYAALGTLALINAKSVTRRHLVELGCHLTIAYAGLLLSKPNTAFPALMLCIACLVIAGMVRFAVIISAATLCVASLALGTVHASLFQMLKTYSGLGDRALPRFFFIGVIPTHTAFGNTDFSIFGLETVVLYFVLCPVLLLCLRLYWRNRAHLQPNAALILGWGCCLVSLIGLGTNVDIKIVDAPAMLLGLAILTLIHQEFTSPLLGRYVAACFSILFLAFFFSLTRARMINVGEWATNDCGPRILFHDSFFGTFHNCAVLPEILHTVDSTIAANPSSRVFFGPRLEFLYARDRISSPRQLPLWWHPGSSYPIKDQANIIHDFDLDHFDLLIFLKTDRTGMPKPLLHDIASNFHQIQGTDQLEIYHRN